MINKLPEHIAIIPDGNRRFAKAKKLPLFSGYKAGYEQLRNLIKEIKKLGIPYVTVWAFSTENWKRSTSETSSLFNLFISSIESVAKDPLFEGMRFVHIGKKNMLHNNVLKYIHTLEEETKHNKGMTVVIALDYGGEDELERASQNFLLSDSKTKKIRDFLDTTQKKIPSPDLIIRTGGEKRTSGFLPIQSAYSEWYFSDVLFPDFSVTELKKALIDYTQRSRRYGA
jgi:undecaprenyl diphosphate synthase